MCGRGRDADLQMRVLVVNAGSSSLKISVLDEPDHARQFGDHPCTRGPGGRGRPPGRRRPLRAPSTPSGTGSSTVAQSSPNPCSWTPVWSAACEALTDLAPLHQPKSLRGLEVVSQPAAQASPPWPASTRRSTPPSRRRPPPTPLPAGMAQALGPAPVRVPRPLALLCLAACRPSSWAGAIGSAPA